MSSTQLVVQDSLFIKLDNDFIEQLLVNKVSSFSDEYFPVYNMEESIKILMDSFVDVVLVTYTKHTKYISMENGFLIRIYETTNEPCLMSLRATKEVMEQIKTLLPIAPRAVKVHWYYTKNTSFASDSFPLKNINQPIDEMYPFIENGMNAYFDSYMQSAASILVLIGPPGTGKTSLLRALLNYVKKDAMMTYDEQLLKDDNFFIQFVKNYSSFLIIEDADTMIRPRDEGNTLVSRFLNLSDGIMDIKNKKIIFTTNLDSVDKIDPALTREGRCHDVLHFRHLHYDEAVKLANKCNIEFDPPSKTGEYAISEIFNKKRNNTPKQKVGFI